MASLFSPCLKARDYNSPGCKGTVSDNVSASYVLDVKPVREADEHTERGGQCDVSPNDSDSTFHHRTNEDKSHEERDDDVVYHYVLR